MKKLEIDLKQKKKLLLIFKCSETNYFQIAVLMNRLIRPKKKKRILCETKMSI